MDRTGGMENAHDTLAPECTGPEARFSHRLGRHRTPPIRSTGTLVCTLEHDVTGRISSTRCETDGRKLTEQRRYAPTSVHVRRNPCSRSPDLVFTFTGLRTRTHRRPARTPGDITSAPPATPLGARPASVTHRCSDARSATRRNSPTSTSRRAAGPPEPASSRRSRANGCLPGELRTAPSRQPQEFRKRLGGEKRANRRS